MSERGFTILELLVALACASLVLAGIGFFGLTMTRFGAQATDQTGIQRQAAMIMDEMTKQIEPAGCTPTNPGCAPLQITTCSGVANSLRVTSPDVDGAPQSFCFRRNVAGEPRASDLANTKLVRDREKPPGTLLGTFDLLSGALINARGAAGMVTTVDGATLDGGGNCGPTAGFCPGVTGKVPALGSGGTTATVTVRLRFQIPETTSYQALTFTSTIAGRNVN
jgi:prepilin-type N-terminal cleavage/methylation domain-containing protein